MVDEIDSRITCHNDDNLTLQSLSKKLGYSEFHTTRRFKEISGMLLGDYIRLRKLAFALIEVRDTSSKFLDIAVKYGFGSHEAFTRAFKTAYGIAIPPFQLSTDVAKAFICTAFILSTRIFPAVFPSFRTNINGLFRLLILISWICTLSKRPGAVPHPPGCNIIAVSIFFR